MKKKIFAGALAASAVAAAAVTGYMKMRRSRTAQAEQVKVGD